MAYSRDGKPYTLELPIEERSIWGVPIQSGVLVLDQDVNMMQKAIGNRIDRTLNKTHQSGWLAKGAWTDYGTNYLKIGPSEFILDGNHFVWDGSFTSDNQITIPESVIPAIHATLWASIWLEMWYEEVDETGTLYRYGNEDYYSSGGNFTTTEIVDPLVSVACTNRIQARYRVNVTVGYNGGVSGYDQVPTDLNLIYPRGASVIPCTTRFIRNSEGTYVADTGDTQYSAVDGKIYGLDIAKILYATNSQTVVLANIVDRRIPSALRCGGEILLDDLSCLHIDAKSVIVGTSATDTTRDLGDFSYPPNYLMDSVVLGNNSRGYDAGADDTHPGLITIGNNVSVSSATVYDAVAIGHGILSYWEDVPTTQANGRYVIVGNYAAERIDRLQDCVIVGPDACRSIGGSYVNQYRTVAIGARAMYQGGFDHIYNTIAIGFEAGFTYHSLADHTGAISIGTKAGYIASEKSIYIGEEAGYSGSTTVTGGNVFIGHKAGRDPVGTAGRAIVIGYMAGINVEDRQTYIGQNPVIFADEADDVLGLYTTQVVSDFVITCGGDIGPYTSGLQVGSTGNRWDAMWSNAYNGASDKRLKENIKTAALGLDFVMQLNPVSFIWKDEIKAEKTETKITTIPKVIKRKEPRIRKSIVEENGKFVQKMIEEDQEVEDLVMKIVPLYDEAGKVIGEHKVPDTEEVEIKKILSPAHNIKHSRTHYGLIAQEVKGALTKLGIDTADFGGYVYDPDSDAYALRYMEFIPPLIKAVQELKEQLDTVVKS